MFLRILFMFFVISAATASLAYVATYTNFFDAGRVKKIAKMSALLTAALFIGIIATILLVSTFS